MAKNYRTAMGDAVDMDVLRLANEETIAIGNMKTNARGDELGSGGRIVRTRAQVMTDYHKLNSSVADDAPLRTQPEADELAPTQSYRAISTPTVEHDIQQPAPVNKPRGALADSIANSLAEQTEVKQELAQPLNSKPNGINRI